MVKLYLKTSCQEVPINDIITTGKAQFFTNLSNNSMEFTGQKDIGRFRLLYNGKILNEDSLKSITDDDAIRVIILPESQIKKPIDEEHRKAVQTELQTLAAPYKNPEDRRLHGFNHDFSLPEHMSKLIKNHPKLVFDSQFVCVLSDWYLFRAYCIRNTFKKDPTRGLFKYTNPEFLQIFKELVTTIGARYGFQSPNFQGFGGPRTAVGGQPITQELLQNALQAALAGVVLPNSGRPPASVPPRVPTPAQFNAPVQPPTQAEVPMQQGYEQQAEALREFGFENRELNLLALEQSNGDLQEAIDFLISLQN